MVAVGIVFKSILDPDVGLLNTTLRVVGPGFLAQQWLINVSLALWSVIGVDTWKGTGYIMVILIAGLVAIPREYYEAAKIDGASGWQVFRYITLPMLRPVLAVTTVLNLLYALRVFDIVYVLTNGGPGYATDASAMSAQPPLNPQWDNFGAVIDQGNLVTAFTNSVLYSFGSTILAVLLAALAAYVLARHRSRRHEIIYLILILSLAVPTNYVTLTKVMQLTHLIDTQIGIILVYAATQIPFDVFLIYAFVDSVPRDLDDAAFIDGCSPLRTFFSVILPMLTPVLVTCGVLNILNVWNDFQTPLYLLGNSNNWPMTLSVYNFFGLYESNWAYISADVVLTILPVILKREQAVHGRSSPPL